MNKSENIWFSAVFEEYRNETLARDGLKNYVAMWKSKSTALLPKVLVGKT